MKIFAVLGLLGAFATGGSLTIAAPAVAGEALPAAMARHLDEHPAAFTASEAKMRRMMIIQRNMNRQQRYGNSGYGHGNRYGHRPGYGPRPAYRHNGGYGRHRY